MDFTKELSSLQKPKNICDSFLFGPRHSLFMYNIDQYALSQLQNKKIFCNSRKKFAKAAAPADGDVPKPGDAECKGMSAKTPTVNWFVKRCAASASSSSTAKSIDTTSSELATGYASIINVDAPPVSSGDGNGTDDCNFINSNDFTLEGPFATKEISQLANSGKLEGVYIRREFDKGFVSFGRMARELPDFIYSERINRYFVENQIVSAAEHSSSCETAHARESRVANFLKSKNINATIEFLVKSIKGQSMFKALKTISGITLLGEEDNRVLIDLIVKETDYQVLSDVDKDGFKVEYSAKKSRRYKK